jgi:hypothetical protein
MEIEPNKSFFNATEAPCCLCFADGGDFGSHDGRNHSPRHVSEASAPLTECSANHSWSGHLHRAYSASDVCRSLLLAGVVARRVVDRFVAKAFFIHGDFGIISRVNEFMFIWAYGASDEDHRA